MTGAVRMIAMNNSDLFIENHKGIKEYTLQKIRIHTDRFEIIIKGKDLELKNMGQENIIVTGEITAIEYET